MVSQTANRLINGSDLLVGNDLFDIVQCGRIRLLLGGSNLRTVLRTAGRQRQAQCQNPGGNLSSKSIHTVLRPNLLAVNPKYRRGMGKGITDEEEI
jgi:hypothetical protein